MARFLSLLLSQMSQKPLRSPGEGICQDAGCGGLEDPTNTFFQTDLWEVRNPQPVSWPAAV